MSSVSFPLISDSRTQPVSENTKTDKIAMTAFGALCCLGLGLIATSTVSLAKISSWPALTADDLERVKTATTLLLTFVGSTGIVGATYGIINCFKNKK